MASPPPPKGKPDKLPKWAMVVAAAIGVVVVYFLFRGKKTGGLDQETAAQITPAFSPTGTDQGFAPGGSTVPPPAPIAPIPPVPGPSGGCTKSSQCPCGQKCHKTDTATLGTCGPSKCPPPPKTCPSGSSCNSATGMCECGSSSAAAPLHHPSSAHGAVAVA